MKWEGDRRQTPQWIVVVGLVVFAMVVMFAEAWMDLLMGGI